MSYPSLLCILIIHKIAKTVWAGGFPDDKGRTGERNKGQQVQDGDVISLSVFLGSLISDGQYIWVMSNSKLHYMCAFIFIELVGVGTSLVSRPPT